MMVEFREPEWFLDKAYVESYVATCTTKKKMTAFLQELKDEYPGLFPGKVYGSHRDPAPRGMSTRQRLLHANCDYVALREEFFVDRKPTGK